MPPGCRRRPGRRQAGEESGLPDVGKADETDVGEDPQLEAQPERLARGSRLGVAGGLVGGGGEASVAPAPSASKLYPKLTIGLR